MIDLKKCSSCKKLKTSVEFYSNKSTKDNLSSICKSCQYDRYIQNKDKLFPKITCSCGKTVYKYYHEKHLMTNYHKNTIIPEAQAIYG